jgi:LysM repeat protein
VVVVLIAMAVGAVLLGIRLVRRGRPEEAAVTPELTAAASLSPSPSASAVPPQEQFLTHTVKSGDTLSAIAQVHDVSVEALSAANSLVDPDFLQIGQVLRIPQEEPEGPVTTAAAERPVAEPAAGEREVPQLPTLTPSGPPLVEIDRTEGVGNLDAEAVVLTNQGGVTSLEAWTVSGSTGDTYVIPALTLFTDGEVSIHTRPGDDTPRDLYWGRAKPAWRAGGLVTLRDAGGNVVDTYIVPES